MKSVRIDIAGQRFGIATVLNFHHTNEQAFWLCSCDCGNEFVASGTQLRNGKTKSCGCLRKTVAKENFQTHGDSKTRFYAIWLSMKNRILNKNVPNYKDYGGRGITICFGWLSYEKFKEDMFHSYIDHCAQFGNGHNTSIERKDTDGNYEPSNCEWATQKEQCNNKRNTPKIVYQGTQYSYQEASRIFGVHSATIRKRINLGWSVIKTLTEPIGKQGRLTVKIEGEI